jgi:SRSO17 transposase
VIFKGEYNKTLMEGGLSDFQGPVRLEKACETLREAFWNHLVREYHYLGSDGMIGSRVKYLVFLGERLVGAISFCSAAYQLGLRDLYVGWDQETRLKYLPGLLNNNRFLILPWVRIKNLASHTLALALRRVRSDWQSQYGVEPFMVETFVDSDRYRGTCYMAANWTRLGTTKGFGKRGKGFVFHGNRKDLYVMVLSRSFARLFRPDPGRLPNVREELLEMINGVPVYRPNILKYLGIKELSAGKFENLLVDHIVPYLPFLRRKEHYPHMVNLIKGSLSNLDRKSILPVCLAFAGKDEVRNMANFMTRARFDDLGMLEEFQRQSAMALSAEGGMITGDGCDFPKKGNKSVGVKRQYCGRLGKTDNCQASIMMGYTSEKGYGLIDYNLYMPKTWFEDTHAALREECQVPEGLEPKTKNEMLSDMINKICATGLFKCKYVGVDSAFGSDSDFLDSLPKELVYFADVKKNLLVFDARPEIIIPEYSGRGRKPVPAPRKVSDIANDPSVPWQDVVLGMGAKGPIMAKDKCIKVIEVRDGKPGKDVWLYIRQLEDGSLKYALCNESMDASLEAVRTPALMRWSMEQCFKECKEYLGMDHYEVRSWPGWRRHILFTLIAHLFISNLRRKYSIKVDTPLAGSLCRSAGAHGRVSKGCSQCTGQPADKPSEDQLLPEEASASSDHRVDEGHNPAFPVQNLGHVRKGRVSDGSNEQRIPQATPRQKSRR